MQFHNLPELACVGGIAVAAALVKIGIWIEANLHGAEARECRRMWFEEIKPKISWPDEDWPPAGQAYEYFITKYDPAADTSAYIAQMEADVREYLDQLGQA